MIDEDLLAARIVRRARACSIDLDPGPAAALARHMLAVIESPPELQLTSVRDPEVFLERHVGESLEGAALLDARIEGWLLDLGSGNGYPGLPVAAARPGLRPLLAEASRRKVAFLHRVLESDFPRGVVIERQVQRADDLADRGELAVVVSRAMGNWERVLPRLASRLRADEGRMLVWAGERMEAVAARAAWRKLRTCRREPLPGRDASWIWVFRRA